MYWARGNANEADGVAVKRERVRISRPSELRGACGESGLGRGACFQAVLTVLLHSFTIGLAVDFDLLAQYAQAFAGLRALLSAHLLLLLLGRRSLSLLRPSRGSRQQSQHCHCY